MSYRCFICKEHKISTYDICSCGTEGDNNPRHVMDDIRKLKEHPAICNLTWTELGVLIDAEILPIIP